MSDIEARRHGGRFASHLRPLETDGEFLKVLGPATVARWRCIERVGEPIARPRSDQAGEMSVEVPSRRPAHPFGRVSDDHACSGSSAAHLRTLLCRALGDEIGYRNFRVASPARVDSTATSTRSARSIVSL